MHCLLFVLYLFFYCGEKVQANEQHLESSFLDSKILLIHSSSSPTLEFVCLKNSALKDLRYFSSSADNPFTQIIDIELDPNASSLSEKFFLSTISSETINHWFVKQYLEKFEVNLAIKPFLLEESSRISNFLENQKEIQLEELVSLNEEMADRNISKPVVVAKTDSTLNKSKPASTNSEEGFTKFALYLIIAGGACMIFSLLAPTNSKGKVGGKVGKIELARRKRWLERILQRGWIDRPTYNFLLKRIENLPEWLGGLKTPVQSPETEVEPETSVAFSKRNNGESVVKTIDTSSDKTSR